MPELIIGCFSTRAGKASKADTRNKLVWQKAEQVDISVSAHVTNGEVVNCNVVIEHSLTSRVDTHVTVVNLGDFAHVNSVAALFNEGVHPTDTLYKTAVDNTLDDIDVSGSVGYHNILPFKDISDNFSFRAVNTYADKPHPPSDYKYTPTTDFSISHDQASFSADFTEPLDFDLLLTPLSPVGFASSLPWKSKKTADKGKKLTYGYGVNSFFVGGGVGANYPVDEDAVNTPEPTQPTRIITIVNNVTVTVLPSKTPLLFSNVKLTKDIDSFSWSCSLTVLDEASYNLIKPSATNTKDIEITINGTVWQFFIGKATRAKQFGNTNYTVTGYSHSAKLQAPYAALNNFSNTSGALASQLVDELLLPTGFTNSWNMPVNWAIAANGFSYQSKSPIDAVAKIASAAGAIIVPHLENKTLTIQPWCSASAWQWNNETGLPVIDEALCFELNEQYTPKEQANAVYVSGNTSGVLLKGKLPSSAGDKLLPTVVDDLITDTSVATERARIALSKAGHKESVPVTTFLDNTTPLYTPGSLVAINMSNESDWNGLVTSLSVSVENAGVAVYQTLNVLRHYNS